MVADVTETPNVIPSLEFKTCMTIKSIGKHSVFKGKLSLGTHFCAKNTQPNGLIKAHQIAY